MLQWDMQSRILYSRIFYLGLSGHGAETHIFEGTCWSTMKLLGYPILKQTFVVQALNL